MRDLGVHLSRPKPFYDPVNVLVSIIKFIHFGIMLIYAKRRVDELHSNLNPLLFNSTLIIENR